MIDIYSEVTRLLIEEDETKSIILKIIKTGSQIFIGDPSDLDYIVICKGYTQSRKRHHIVRDGLIYDILIYDIRTLEVQFDFTSGAFASGPNKLYNYFYCLENTLIYGDPDIGTFDILKKAEDYKEYLLMRYSGSVGKLKVKTKFTKGFVHYYIILKIIKNQSVTITDEIKKNVNILYAGGEAVLPIVEWIEKQIGFNK